MDYVAVRERSVRRLARFRLSDPGVLPLHRDEDFDWVRDAHSVAARCHAIAAALALQQKAPPSRIRSALRDNDLARWLARSELRFLRHLEGEDELTPDELHQAAVDISWREEALWALLWALELVDDLPPDQLCSGEPFYERLAPDMDPSRGLQDVALRWDSEIVPGAVLERRRALEWLFQDLPWEDVDLGA